MSGIRNSRTRTSRNSRTRLVGAAASVVLAALSLTACSEGTGIKDEGASAPAGASVNESLSKDASDKSEESASQEAMGGESPSSADEQSEGTGGSEEAANTADTKAPASAGKNASGSSSTPVTCEGSNTKTVASVLKRPLNHMLLTVTNTGSKPCFLYTYPAVAFGEAQSVPPVMEDTQPQAVVTLEPGQSGYAAVILSAGDGSGSNGRTENSLSVYFHGRSGNESVGKGATPALPDGGVYIDDSLRVTYWQQEMEDALN
ncbi:DUF4232 domain-containing protein [Streptomyces sp. NRRL F-5135]|uniref:DUF4232 domain-containing protein n=1 Tax=Streptomyces sp. NRRL F-5135 TaxID=1463858 RepID=UPI0004CA9CDF|nr:DUF4232 domain-containing protein [Streptomyces sp. NRRL F-5135]